MLNGGGHVGCTLAGRKLGAPRTRDRSITEKGRTVKYIIFRTTVAGAAREVPVMFPQELVHRQVALRLERLIREIGDGDCAVVAAGTVRVDSVVCTERSETLNVDSRGSKDKRLIESFDLLHGWES
jgi:hypothetical protein